MTNRLDNGEKPSSETSRVLACPRCGAVFSCALSETCWCASEPVRLPVPTTEAETSEKEDCLCPACLRAAADKADGN